MNEMQVVASLRAGGSVYAEEEARLLLGAASSGDEVTRLVARRVAGEPIEVIVGWAEFCGHRILLDAGVFVPRTRTGILVEEGARLARPGSVVVDLCCGTGAVAVALHQRFDALELYASDIEPAAVRCARRNLEPIGGQVFQGDLFGPLPEKLRGRIDLLVVNAPYVPTRSIALLPREARDHEPALALDGGADGVRLHRRIAAEAANWLAPLGHLLIETSRQQATLTEAALHMGGLEARTVTAPDIDGTAVVGAVGPA